MKTARIAKCPTCGNPLDGRWHTRACHEAAEITKKPQMFVWLQEGETEGTAECGCRLVANHHTDGTTLGGAALFMCPLHESAPDMLTEVWRVGRTLEAVSKAVYQASDLLRTFESRRSS